MTNSAPLDDRLNELFAAIDGKDTETFLEFLTEDGVFRFGSAPPVDGHEAIGAAVDGFFQSIAGSTHRLLKVLRDGDTMACEGEVTYRRLDGSELTLPFTNIFDLAGERIRNYKIYIDIQPLFAQ